VVCAHLVALIGGSGGEGKFQVVTELGMLDKTDDDDDEGGGGGAAAYSSQTEEPAR
jgi:hypothetical protein